MFEGALQGYGSTVGEGGRARSRGLFALGWRRPVFIYCRAEREEPGFERKVEVKWSKTAVLLWFPVFPRSGPVISLRCGANAQTHNTGLCIKRLRGEWKDLSTIVCPQTCDYSKVKGKVWLSPNPWGERRGCWGCWLCCSQDRTNWGQNINKTREHWDGD